MLKLTKEQCIKIFVLYTLLALAAFFCYNVKVLWGPARKRPFQCSDTSLAKPFVDDTVSPRLLHLLGIYLPIVLIATFELICGLKDRKSDRNHSWKLTYILRTLVIWTLFLIGLAVERLYKNVAKIMMGRLRPNFIKVCEPVTSSGIKCFSLQAPDVMQEYTCSSTVYPSWAVSSAFSSFPSGHTSLTAYSMVFVIYYLHLCSLKPQRLPTSFRLVALITQALGFLVILFVGMSRILDFRHHWSDVCAGFIGGSLVALAVTYYFKTQLQDIDKWLREVTGGCTEDKTGYVDNKNMSAKEVP